MSKAIPTWALETAGPGDREQAVAAQRRGRLWTSWDLHPEVAGRNVALRPPAAPSREWAKARGWPAPWLGFRKAFLAHMLASDESFALALAEGGVELYFPKRHHALTAEEVAELDALYEERGENGRPTGWGPLVSGLREIRRAVEAGVVVEVEGRRLGSWGSFYDWAHGRYHALEDGYDSWIGDDKS